MLIDDEYVDNMEGQPHACKQDAQKTGYFQDSGALFTALGHGSDKELSELTPEARMSINRITARFRCRLCRAPVGVGTGHPAFPTGGHGSSSISTQVYIHWLVIEGHSNTQICRILNLSSPTVTKFATFVRYVLCWKVWHLQRAMKFGFMPDSQVQLVEVDETSEGYWEIEEDGTLCYYWFILVGFIARGRPDLFWWTILRPFPKSREKAKFPKMTNHAWKAILDQVVMEGANIGQISDSLSCYLEVGSPGIVAKGSVNHTEGIYARSAQFLVNVETRKTEHIKVGTQIIDQAWRRQGENVPDNLTAKTAKGRILKEGYLRAQQWRMLNRHADSWPLWVQTLNQWKDSGDTFWGDDAKEAGSQHAFSVDGSFSYLVVYILGHNHIS